MEKMSHPIRPAGDALGELAFADLSGAQSVRRRTTESIDLCDQTRGVLITAIGRPRDGGDSIANVLAISGTRHAYLLEYPRPEDRIEDPRAIAALRGFCAK